jgi:hypothetical protein
MLHRVVLQKLTDVQRCIVPHKSDYAGNKHLSNVGQFLRDHKVQRPRRLLPSHSSKLKSQEVIVIDLQYTWILSLK